MRIFSIKLDGGCRGMGLFVWRLCSCCAPTKRNNGSGCGSLLVLEASKGFATPQQAAMLLSTLRAKFDQLRSCRCLFKTAMTLYLLEKWCDRLRTSDFAAEAREKKTVSVDPKGGNRAFLLVGNEDWPFPVTIVKKSGKWYFDSKAGRHELLYRRIGANELDAIQICHGYVEAQQDYAFRKREGYDLNQYAQRIISTPGKQDGWRKPLMAPGTVNR
jgi:hypothetical protein